MKITAAVAEKVAEECRAFTSTGDADRFVNTLCAACLEASPKRVGLGGFVVLGAVMREAVPRLSMDERLAFGQRLAGVPDFVRRVQTELVRRATT